MLKFLLLAVIIYCLYRLFANDLKKKLQREDKEDKAEMEQKIAAGEMVQDPVCGTYVAVDSAISVRNGKDVYYFCSYNCRDKFLQHFAEKHISSQKDSE